MTSTDKDERNDTRLIISVESRKGGVGKTTAALCLARLLRSKGYAVLFLDLDITGTDAVDFASSSFWRKDIHVVRKPEGWGEATPKDGDTSKTLPKITLDFVDVAPLPASSMVDETQPAVNLIKLFDLSFIGSDSPDGLSQPLPFSDTMQIHSGRINLVGSHIFASADEETFGSKPKQTESSQKLCIAQPSVLFDDIHSFWVIEFVERVVENFINAVSMSTTSQKPKTAVVIDNSPGYVGFSPAIHDWLTDRGPLVSKFLSIMSVDSQDLRANDHAITALHGMYRAKWQTSQEYGKSLLAGSQLNIPQDQEPFFLRLATSGESKHPDDNLSFYRAHFRNKQGHARQSGGAFLRRPERYIGCLINRAPTLSRELIARLMDDFKEPHGQKESCLSKILTSGGKNSTWRERMVSYNDDVAKLFWPDCLLEETADIQTNLRALARSLSDAEEELSSLSSAEIEFPVMPNRRPESYIRQKCSSLTHVQTMFARIGKQLRASELANEVASLRRVPDLFPTSFIREFNSAFRRFVREVRLTYEERSSLMQQSSTVSDTKASNAIKVFRRVSEGRNTASHMHTHSPPAAKSLYATISIVAAFCPLLTPPSGSFPLALFDLLACVVSAEVIRFSKWKVHRQDDLRLFLKNESHMGQADEGDEIAKCLQRFLRRQVSEDERKSTLDLYGACAYAQLRVIDLLPDSKLLVNLFKTFTEHRSQRKAYMHHAMEIAESVIVKKDLSHDEGEAEMKRLPQELDCLHEFTTVLRNVLKDWEIPNV